jgi:ribosomal protein S18 acetylase RimI-like enzyme
MTISLATFTIESYDEVFTLWRQTPGVGLSSADSRVNIELYLDRNPGMSYLAKTPDGRVVGTILCGHDGRRGYIHHLTVHPDFRREGLASALVRRCEQELNRAGIQKCHLFIFNENTNGLEFWNSIGWTHRSDIGVISKNLK